jgi:hypothetical protein
MAKYLFGLQSLQISAQRSTMPEGDWNVVTFGVEVGANSFGPLQNNGGTVGGATGSTVDFTTVLRLGPPPPPPYNLYPPAAIGKWWVGPIDVADTDIVSVDYSVVNAEYTLSGASDSNETVIDISTVAWAALVGITVGAFGGPAGQVVTALAAAFSGGLTLLLHGTPNCDGVVGADKRQFTGAELKQATNNPQRTVVISDQSGNPDTPSGCNQSSIVMTFFITWFPEYSLRWFLKSDVGWEGWVPPNTSFRNATSYPPGFYSGSSTSVRNLIETWQLDLIS